MKDNIAAVVILYKPNYEEVLLNISSYIKRINKLYLFLNSNIENHFYNKLKEFENIELLNNGKNLGISKALNIVLKKANKDKYEWLLTMDQDTSFEKDDFNSFLESFRLIKEENLLIYSPIHNKKFINREEKSIFKEYVMTSANIIDVKKTIFIGGFDEKLFIDEVDHEFCFRGLQNGYKIIQNPSISVHHNLGDKINNKSFYPSIRLYYMIRNYLYIRKKYKINHSKFFKNRDKYLFSFTLRHFIFSSERVEIFKIIMRALKDYKNKKFGKYVR